MRTSLLLPALALAVLGAGADAAPRRYELPDETAAYAPGPGVELAQRDCSGCHSADYVATQPRPLRNARGFWQAEVAKMKAVYGAPIAQEDIAKLVDYLAATYD